MKSLLLGLCCLIALIWTSDAVAADSQVVAPIHQFIDGFNKGDMKAAAASHVADVVIIDEPAPHLWRGTGAFQAWLDDLTKDSAKRGRSDEAVALEEATREEVDGDRAYVVVPATYIFKEKGVAMREPAQMTFVLQKIGAEWKISAWTWTGPRPEAVK